MYKQDLALNNLQWLICHKTKPNQIICSSQHKDQNNVKKKFECEITLF